ncbi:MAG TPA: hypothetical protein VGX23_01055 [Actinocrinis sp.]|nr:hypothetical protein [Actinocrinis sp.]
MAVSRPHFNPGRVSSQVGWSATIGSVRGIAVPLWSCALLISLVYALFSLSGASQARIWNDTYQYTVITEQDLGHSHTDSQHLALAFYCGGQADPAACTAAQTGGVLTPDNPTYDAIFTPRAGVPLLIAAFTPALGPRDAWWLAVTLFAIAAGLLTLAVLRLLGASPQAALAGQVLYFILPTGTWAAAFLVDGPVVTTTLLVIFGALLVLRGRMRLGLALTTLGCAMTFAVKYSQSMLLAGLLLLAVLVALVARRGRPRSGLWALAGTSAGALLLGQVISSLLHLPGLRSTLDEQFSGQFRHPLPAHPYSELLSAQEPYWWNLLQQQAAGPVLVVGLTVGLWVLWHRERLTAVVISAVSSTGIAAAFIHPTISQGSRLYVEVYLLPLCGLPLLLDRWTTDARSLDAERPLPEAELEPQQQVEQESEQQGRVPCPPGVDPG